MFTRPTTTLYDRGYCLQVAVVGGRACKQSLNDNNDESTINTTLNRSILSSSQTLPTIATKQHSYSSLATLKARLHDAIACQKKRSDNRLYRVNGALISPNRKQVITRTVQSYSPGGANVHPIYYMHPWAHPSPRPKRHLDWLSRFSTAHDRHRPTDHATRSVTISTWCCDAA